MRISTDELKTAKQGSLTMKERRMKELIQSLGEYLIAKGCENGKEVYHFLLPNGDVIEVVV